MPKVTKATEAERAAYAATGAVYPLYGWVKQDDHRLAVEDLRGSWSTPDPIYEVMAPDGHHFAYDYTHSLLCHSLKDVINRLQRLEKCGEDCGNYNGVAA